MRLDRCSNGHPWNAANTRWIGPNHRQCRACACDRQNSRYRNDPAFRQTEKSRSLRRYYQNKSAFAKRLRRDESPGHQKQVQAESEQRVGSPA